jgi:16S rRNA (cytosine967-C5)-methyltransferase
LPGYNEGWWSVQDESALKVGELLNPVAGERILDLCAAPGGKSTHLAELSRDQATVIACDVSESRLARVAESVERLQLANVFPTLIGRQGEDLPEGPYDAVLVDVPCSNTGVLSRRPEARWRFHEADLQELVQLQTRLLLTAWEQVRPGGRIVSSTCSIEPEVTTQLIDSVTALIPGLTIIKQQLQLPGEHGDGAFQALLQKQS